MQFDRFRYYFKNTAGLYYTIPPGYGSGVITTSEETPLETAPSGWQEQAIGWIRNTTYSNVFRSFTVPLRYAKKSAKILRYRLYNYGIEDNVTMIIKRLNTLTGAYDPFYEGEIDLSTYDDTEPYFDVKSIEGGIMKYIKAFESTDFDIDLSGANVINVEMDGLDLQKKITFAIVDQPTNRGVHTVGCVYATEEGTSFGVLTGNSPLQDVADFDATTNDDRWIIKLIDNISPIVFNVKGTIHIYVNSIPQDFHMFLLKNSGGTADLIPNQTLSVGNHTFNVNVNITVNQGERVFIKTEKTEGFGDSDKFVQYSNDSLFFSFVTHFKTTYVKAINAEELGKRLLQKMCGTGYSFSSAFLNACGIYLTSGDGLRGLSGAKIKTNWKDFFASFNRNLNIGLSVSGNEATIDSKLNYYTSDNIYDLGFVKDAKFSFYNEALFNTIKIGYPDQTYDDVNGKDEFNGTYQYTTVITRVKKELDLTAPYRADAYGVELLRINLENRQTVDSSSDNDTFMLDVLPGSPYYQLNRPAYSLITGVLNPTTIFNTRLSPARLIRIHGATIRSSLWKQEGTVLTFQSTAKNSSLITTLDGVTITENANILVSELAAPYYIPIQVEAETITPDSLMSLMANYGNGQFTFEYRGVNYNAYCLEAKQKPSGNESQTFTMLLSADNNMQNLIHG